MIACYGKGLVNIIEYIHGKANEIPEVDIGSLTLKETL